MHGFVQKVHQRVRERRLIRPNESVVLAVSGGPDSVAMARALCTLHYRVCLAWVDHGHRESAAADGELVGTLAEALGVPYVPLRAHPSHLSEEGLRDARYAALDTVAGDRVATAHTASDQAETVLMRMIRGAGTAGLAGIPDTRGRYIRPLLGVTRSEVMEYLGVIEQPFSTDPTNASLDPLRNRVRHVLLPLLAEEFQPNIVRSLVRLADASRSDREALEALAAAHIVAHGASIPEMRRLPEGLRKHVLRTLSPVPMTSERTNALNRLVVGDAQGMVQLEGGVFARRERGQLVFRDDAAG